MPNFKSFEHYKAFVFQEKNRFILKFIKRIDEAMLTSSAFPLIGSDNSVCVELHTSLWCNKSRKKETSFTSQLRVGSVRFHSSENRDRAEQEHSSFNIFKNRCFSALYNNFHSHFFISQSFKRRPFDVDELE